MQRCNRTLEGTSKVDVDCADAKHTGVVSHALRWCCGVLRLNGCRDGISRCERSLRCYNHADCNSRAATTTEVFAEDMFCSTFLAKVWHGIVVQPDS